jgi:arsenate reductase (thioredoxin)
MGCVEECPIIPGVEREDWPLPDPKGKTIAEVRVIRAEITARIRKLIEQKAVGR